MRKYRTGLYEAGLEAIGLGPFRGRGWQVDLEHLITIRKNGIRDDEFPNPEEVGHSRMIASGRELPDGSWETTYCPQIIISAPTYAVAQRSLDCIIAAYEILNGYGMKDFYPAIPYDSNDKEYKDLGFEYAGNLAWLTHGLSTAARFACRISHRNRWRFSLARLWSSVRALNISWHDLHPIYGSRYGVEEDPLILAVFAQSITSAYAAIEQLGFEIRADAKNPSTIGGDWNPKVLDDLKRRLADGGISPHGKTSWILRNPPTRVERGRAAPAGEKAEWSRSWVRDRLVSLPDAIKYSSFLRSKAAAHGGASIMKSVTFNDVVNVQLLARRLLLETTGFWIEPGQTTEKLPSGRPSSSIVRKRKVSVRQVV